MVTFLSVALHLGATLTRMIRIGTLLPDEHVFEVRHPIIMLARPHSAATLAQTPSPAVTADNRSRPFPVSVPDNRSTVCRYVLGHHDLSAP